jgi:hypothetical protein
MIDRTQIKAGDFLVGGPPADAPYLTKVHTTQNVEETDERFDEAARWQEILAQTKKALDALKSRN